MRIRRSLRIRGTVQGVGFRPFVHNLATRLNLAGSVLNDTDGVVVEVEGEPSAVDEFEAALEDGGPPLATIEAIEAIDLEPSGGDGFVILASERAGERRTPVVPDAAVCGDCVAEISDPVARRYRYPFTNCTNCGPRFTITTDVPYDRPNTTMASFGMCPECRAEYEDPADRRFHAQPIACPACGPQLSLTGSEGASPGSADPIRRAGELLASGSIVAVKGIGGFHLACDASDADVVARLRARKYREDKPFAVMVAEVADASRLCTVDATATALLRSPRAPIVLLPRRPDAPVAPSVAPGNRDLGVLLAYTPLHHLLLTAFDDAGGRGVLVMTSGNVSDEPIAFTEADAYERLAGIADAFLVHDRPIHIRCDDSVVRTFRGDTYPIRRARGFAPEPLALASGAAVPILAAGGELKHTFCFVKNDRAFMSHHIGDLENWETMQSFVQGIEHFARIFEVDAEVIAYDLHPEYLSTKWAQERSGVGRVGVQHHHAHIASCLADNRRSEPVIGLALDGTGWGDDGTVWGCEILVADLTAYERVGHLRSVPLPGGAAAIREPWRMGAVYLAEAFGVDAAELPLDFARRTHPRWGPVLAMARAGVNAVETTSAGRLFDAVAAVCGVRDTANYEGQAAIELEQIAGETGGPAVGDLVQSSDGVLVIDGVRLVRDLVESLLAGAAVPAVAHLFHRGLAEALIECCVALRRERGLGVVALSGGTFQNVLLLDRTVRGLEERAFEVLAHRRVPANDGGLSLGQAAVAAARAGVLRR